MSNSTSATTANIQDQATTLANRGLTAVQDSAQQLRDKAEKGVQQLRDKAERTSDVTASYIKNEPLKSVLIAAATGAALMALAGMIGRRS